MTTMTVEIEENGVKTVLEVQADYRKECRAMAFTIRDKEFPDGKIVSLRTE
jgi:hypothetical protein